VKRPDAQKVLFLRHDQRLAPDEIAVKLGASVAAVSRILARFEENKTHVDRLRPGPNRGVGRIVDQRRRRNAG
jgi:hypothetical protein